MVIFYSLTCHCTTTACNLMIMVCIVHWKKKNEVKLSGNTLKMPSPCRCENALNSKYQLQNKWLNKNALGHRSDRNYNSVIIYSPLYMPFQTHLFFFLLWNIKRRILLTIQQRQSDNNNCIIKAKI